MRSSFINDAGHLVEPRRAHGPVRFLALLGRMADYLFGILYALLLVRLALEFFGASARAGFFVLIRRMTDLFYAPFKGIFAVTVIDGGRVAWSLVVCILAYVVLHALIRGLLRLLARA